MGRSWKKLVERAVTVAGALPFFVLYPVYLGWLTVQGQIGPYRMLGLLGVIGLALIAIAGLASLAVADRTLVGMLAVLTGVRPHEVLPHVDNVLGYVQKGALTGMAGHLRAAGYRSRWVTMKVAPDLLGLDGEFVEGRRHNYFLPSNQFNTAEVLPVREVAGWFGDRLLRRPPKERPGVAHDVLATRESFRQAKAYLDAEPGRTFVWVHIGAPHLPYYVVPTQDLGGPLRPERYRRVLYDEIRYAKAGQMPALEAAYESYCRFVDAELGLFVDQLRRDARWGSTLLVVLADHGEEHQVGVMPHGTGTLAEDITRVPLVIHRPRQTKPERIDALVGHEDVLPTVLGQVYRQQPPGLPGRDLLSSRPTARTLYSWGRYEHYTEREFPGDEVAAYDGRYKYVRDFTSGREALYDLRSDPGALRNLAAETPERTAAMRERMERDQVH